MAKKKQSFDELSEKWGNAPKTNDSKGRELENSSSFDSLKEKWSSPAVTVSPNISLQRQRQNDALYQLAKERSAALQKAKDTAKRQRANESNKFRLGTAAKDAGASVLTGMAGGAAAAGAWAEDLVGGAIDLVFRGAGWKGKGLFNTLYNGDTELAKRLGIQGIKNETEYFNQEAQANADKIDTGHAKRDKLLKGAANTANELAYGLGNAVPMAAAAMLGAPAAAANGLAAVGSDGLIAQGASVIEKAGLSNALKQQLKSKDYWTAFAQEVGQDYYEALDDGASVDQANVYAIATALMNSGIEIGGGIQNVNQRLWKSALEEGKEEIEQGPIGRLMKNVVYGKGNPLFSTEDEDAVINPAVMAKEFGMGAAVGGLLGGAQRGIGNAINNAEQKRYDEAVAKPFKEGGVESLVEEGLESAEGTESRKLAEQAKAKLDGGADLSNAEVAQLARANENAVNDEVKSAAEKRLTEMGETSDVRELAEIIAKEKTGYSLTTPEKVTLADSRYGKAVSDELQGGNDTTDEQNAAESVTEPSKAINSETVRDAVRVVHNGWGVSDETADKIISDNEAVKDIGADIEGVAHEEQRSIVKQAVNKLASEYTAEDIAKDSSVGGVATDVAVFTDMASKAGMSADFAEEVFGSVKGSVASQRGAIEAYKYGTYGFPFHEISQNGFAAGLSAEQRAYIYNKGVIDGKVRVAQEANKNLVKNVGKSGKLIYDTDTAVDKEKLKPVQRASLDVAEKMASAFGTTIHVYESVLKGGKRVMAKDVGNMKAGESAPNGFYDHKTGEIYIDINAGNNGEGVMLYTLAHEYTHMIRQFSGEKFKALSDFLFDQYGKNGVSVSQLVHNQMAKAKKNGRTISFDTAYEEVVADSMEQMLTDPNFAQRMQELKAKDKTLWQKLKDLFKKLVDSLKSASTEYKQYAPGSLEATLASKFDADVREKLAKLYAEAFEDATDNMASAVESVGVSIDTATESANPVMLSERTWSESDYVKNRDAAAKELADAIGISVSKAKAYIDSVNSVAKAIANDRTRLDYEASKGVSSFVGNSEYGGSIDFSTICKKRRLLTGTFSAIQQALPNTALTADEVLTIRKMMDDKGYEVSCGLCYVEGSRAKMGEYAKDFLDQYAKTNPEYLPNMAEVNTPDGLEKIRMEHPEVYEAYRNYMNKLAQRKPKLYQMATEYQGEVLDKFKGKRSGVAEKNKNGGLRLQSFSDFEIIHLIDCMQVVMDMSRVGLAGQAYTKVPDFAAALGATGTKINLSLIAKGVDANGNLILDEKEGMKQADAKRLRDMYSDNVGTIIVVFNDEQLNAAMKDNFIDFIIPFHRSQWNSAQYKLMGLPENSKDYTMLQNESYIEPVYNAKGKKTRPANYMPNEYWDFSKTGKENAEAYLQMCAINNRKPKFSHLLVDNHDGSYSLQPDGSTDGYWKLLIDFKMYNNDGVGVPQQPVKPNFNMDEAIRMLDEYKGGHQQFPVANDIVDEFVGKYKEEHQGVVLSDRDSEYLELAKDPEANRKQLQKMVDDAAAAAGYTVKVYHGTANGGHFTKFDAAKLNNSKLSSHIGQGFYFTNDAKAAKEYTSNFDIYGRRHKGKNPHLFQGYLKLTNPIEITENSHKLSVETIRDIVAAGDNTWFFNDGMAHYLQNQEIHGVRHTKDDIIAMSLPQRLTLFANYLYQSGDMAALQGMVDAYKFDNQGTLLKAMQTYTGNDGVVWNMRDGLTQYVAFGTAQFKESDPVTYDDNGNVIPLSERFNSESDDIRYSDRDSKQEQFDIIKQANPAEDDYHTWIRSADEILTLQEAVSDPDWNYDEYNPDWTRKMAQKALDTGKVTVYSSKPIANGIFVSPSKMEAQSYSANGKVYSKTVDIGNVAWIDPTQGQYAEVVAKMDDRGSVSSFVDDGYGDAVLRSDRVTDEETLTFLNEQMENGDVIHTYKAMQLIDGKLYPPMAAKVKGEDGKYRLTNPSEVGVWQQATEDPANIKKIKNGVGYYTLNKGNGKSVDAAYNPYEHSSNLVLNDQFEEAYQRPNIVTVECVIPKSEMESGYRAEYAKDSTGFLDWKSGVVAGKLKGNKRKVYLSRWLMPVRIMSDEETARLYKETLGNSGVSVPFNVVPPSLKEELEKLGVPIDYEGSPMYRAHNKSKSVSLSDRDSEYDPDWINEDELDDALLDGDWLDKEFKKMLDKGFDFDKAIDKALDLPFDRSMEVLTKIEKALNGNGVDSNGNKLSEAQDAFFSDSAVRDKNMHLCPVYHYTDSNFTKFENAGMSKGSTRTLGDGYYVSTSETEFQDFGKNKMVMYANITNPFTPSDVTLTEDQANIVYDKYFAQHHNDTYGTYRPHVIGKLQTWSRVFDYLKEAAQTNGTTTSAILSELGYDGVHDGSEWVAFESNQLKSVDNLNPTGDGDIRYSDRDANAMDNRTLLANAMESAAKNDIEKQRISEYKAKIESVNAEEQKLGEIKAQIKEMSFSKGARDTKKLNALKLEKAKTENRINIYDKQLLRLEASAPLKAVVERERVKARKAAEKRGKAALAEYKAKVEAKYEKTVKRYQESRKKGVENRKAKALRDSIGRTANDFRQMILHPTDSRYAPIDLMQSCLDVALMLDTSGAQEGTKAKAKFNSTMDALREVRNQYESLRNNPDSDYSLEFDQDFAYMVGQMEQHLKGKAVRDLTLDELEDIHNILHDIKTMLQDAKHQIGKKDRVTNYSVGESIIRDAETVMPRSKAEKAFDATFRLTGSTLRNVRRMAQYNGDAAIVKLFDDINDGIKKKNTFMMESDKLFEQFLGERFRKAASDVIEYDTGKRTIRMTEMEAIQTVLTWEREMKGKTNHIMRDGITIPDHDLMKRGKYQDAMTKGTLYSNIDEEEIFAIARTFDDWAADYKGAVSKFFNGKAKDAINETTMQTKHRPVAMSDDYIPIETDKNYIASELEGVKFDATIEGMGMLKSVVEGASNPIIIRGLHNVVENHIERVGQLYGLAIPIRNFNKAFNIREIGRAMTPKKAIGLAWTAEDVHLIEQAITDLQTPRSRATDVLSKTMHKAQSKFVEATLLSNISVTIKQAASYSTAGLYLSQKALAPYQGTIAKLFANNNSKYAQGLFAEIDAHTPEHYIRRKGMSMQEISTIAQDKSKAVRWMDEKLPDAVNPLKWIQNMDVATTGALWQAAKKQVELDGTKPADEGYWDKVTTLYEKVIENTQPMYDVLHRPEVQKTTNELVRNILMFRTQPLQNSGILYDAAGELAQAKKSGDKSAIEKASKQMRSAVGSQIASLAVFATMTLIAYAVRNRLGRYKDDEEELTVESVVKRILGDMGGNALQLMMPIGGDVVSGGIEKAISGSYYGGEISVPVVDMLNDYISGFNDVWKDVADFGNGGKEKLMGDSRDLAMNTAGLLGIPANNVYNIFRGVIGNVTDIAGNPLDWATDESEPTMKVVNTTFANGHNDKAKEKINSVIAGKVAGGKTEKEAKSSVRSSMTSYWKPLYKQASADKNEEEMVKIRKIMKDSGVYGNATDIVETCRDWLKN